LPSSLAHNLNPHRVPGYVRDPLHEADRRHPGRCVRCADGRDCRSCRTYGQDEIRISHEQNVILPHVLDDLPALFDQLVAADMAEGNAGLITDIIACPGMDYCALATARSIPVAQAFPIASAQLSVRRRSAS
jgi:sulfite reductase (NADPH) hemoprotein beta-component